MQLSGALTLRKRAVGRNRVRSVKFLLPFSRAVLIHTRASDGNGPRTQHHACGDRGRTTETTERPTGARSRRDPPVQQLGRWGLAPPTSGRECLQELAPVLVRRRSAIRGGFSERRESA